MADQDVRVESPDRDGATNGTAYDFLRGGGELGALMRAKGWSETPFGPLERWPQSLRSAVSICLDSGSRSLFTGVPDSRSSIMTPGAPSPAPSIPGRWDGPGP